MDTSNDAAVGTIAHPNMQYWDMAYEADEDIWTKEAVNQKLMGFLDTLTNGKTGLDILVPMCGKTKIMLYLAEKGHRVVGIEWSKVAVEQFFDENKLEYTTQLCKIGGTDISIYKAKDKAVTVYCGDFFAFKEHNLGPFDCVFDHGAIGCFEFQMSERPMYAKIINSVTKPGTRVLQSIFDYEHTEHPMVPFALTEAELVTLYKENFDIQLLQEFDAQEFVDAFRFPSGSERFPVLTFSHFSWKILLLVKN